MSGNIPCCGGGPSSADAGTDGIKGKDVPAAKYTAMASSRARCIRPPERPIEIVDDGQCGIVANNAAKTVGGDGNGAQKSVESDCNKDRKVIRESALRPNDRHIGPLAPEPELISDGDCCRVEHGESPKEDGRTGELQQAVRPSIGILRFCGWVVLVLLGLCVFSMSSPFLRDALVLEGWKAFVSLILGLFPSIAVICLVGFTWKYFRGIPEVEQFCKDDFGDDSALQSVLQNRYLSCIPDAGRYAISNGFAEGGKQNRVEQVAACIRRLRGEDDGNYSDSYGWIREFQHLQRLQDERAEEIVKSFAARVAILTSASSWKALDRLVVAYQSAVMIVNIAHVYNRKMSGPSALKLGCGWMINVCVAGELGDIMQTVFDNVLNRLGELAGKIVGKTAEGAVNAALIYRLGRRAKDYFRPLT